MPPDHVRRELMTTMGNLSVGTGLEIGPLNRPVALKSHCDVRYVDVFDSSVTREHYKDDPNVDVDTIPDLDFCLHTPDGRIQTLVEAVKTDAPYTWVLASHVIEHVPDLIGWLTDIAAVLDDAGKLVLAIPDQRYTFDVLRPPTTIGQILQANDDRDTIPSIRAVYDHFRSNVDVPAGDLWAGRMPTENNRVYDLTGTLDQLARARDQGLYVDSHVWLFTPGEFVRQINELGRMNLVEFFVERIDPTEPGELEFYVVMQRLPRDISPVEADELRATGVTDVVDKVLAPPEPVAPETELIEPEPPAQEPQEEPELTTDPPFVVSDLEMKLIRAKRRMINALLRRPKP